MPKMYEQTILEKLRQLPQERIAEVEDFIDFLAHREAEERGLTHAADNSPQPPSRESGATPPTPTMTGYKFGDLVLVPFSFTDQSAIKRRPGVRPQRLVGNTE